MPSFDDFTLDLSVDATSSKQTSLVPSLPPAPTIDLLGGLGDMAPGEVSFSPSLAAQYVDILEGRPVKDGNAPRREFLTPAGDGSDDFILYIDNSSLEMFNTCNRKAYHYGLCGREGSALAAPLTFGGAIHSALEQRYKRGLMSCSNDTPVTIKDSETIPLAVLQDAYIERYMRGIVLHEDEHRTTERAKSVVRYYNEQYPVEPFAMIKGPDGSPLCEIGFAVPLGKMVINRSVHDWRSNDNLKPVRIGTVHIVWTGRIDLPVIWDNEPTIIDHKTTIMLGATFSDQFRLAPQMLGYIWAANNIPEIVSLLGGRRFNSACVNAICVRKYTVRGKGVPTQFERNRYFYDQSIQDEWKTDTLCLVGEFLNNWIDGYFPKKANWCIGKYGACQYHDVCCMPVGPQRMMMLNSPKFRDVTWNPLDER